MDALAARLGIGSRHMRRLFLKHLGASPIAVAQTRRLHFAKKLIDETRLPMRDVALASGYGSIRRFNATFLKTYERTPTHLRKASRKTETLPDSEYRFLLRFRPPFCWTAMLEFLAPRAIPGVEVVEGGSYRRVFSLNNHVGSIKASLDHASESIVLSIHYPQPQSLFLIVERARSLFDLSADPHDIAAHLRRDPLLARRVAARPGIRVPGSWDGFELAIRAILGQQVTVQGATTLAGRLVRAFGMPIQIENTNANGSALTHLFPSPEILAQADLRQIGLPGARARSIQGLAQSVRDGKIAFSGVANVSEFLQQLRKLPGIGEWTAEYIAMRALNEPDAFPASDLGLLRASGLDDPRTLQARAEAWRPWRAYAAMYLWQAQPAADRSSRSAVSAKNKIANGKYRTRNAASAAVAS
jgi:AraC family transcriptional regulator of adaptative response / DNA-3-methyladenine glycosylase II